MSAVLALEMIAGLQLVNLPLMPYPTGAVRDGGHQGLGASAGFSFLSLVAPQVLQELIVFLPSLKVRQEWPFGLVHLFAMIDRF